MNLKTIARYVDKYSREIVEPGTVLTDVQEARAAELISAGVAEEQKANKIEKPRKQKAEKREPIGQDPEVEEEQAE